MKISVVIFMALLVVVSSQDVFAEKQIQSIEFFDNRYLRNHELPIVCFHEPEQFNNGLPNQILYDATTEAINTWVYKLEEASGEQDIWNIGLKVIGNETSYGHPTQWFMYECDVNIIFMGAPTLDVNTGGYFKGGARHIRGVTAYSDVILYTWDYYMIDPRTLNMTEMKARYGNNLTDQTQYYEVKPVDYPTLVATLEHELGHAFGLKHHFLNGKERWGNDYDKDHASMSIMYYLTPRSVLEEEKVITSFDTTAIMTKYSTDGWGGITNYEMYQYSRYS